MERLETQADVDRAFEAPLALLFKHSPTCGISARAHQEMSAFLTEHPDHRIQLVDVLRSRDVSQYLAERAGVRHESPQLLVVKDGDVVWHDSHGGVTAAAVARALL